DEGDQLVGHAVVVEQITRHQQQVHPILQREVDEPPEHTAAALVVRRLPRVVAGAVTSQVNVGGVEDAKRSSRPGHRQQYTPRRRWTVTPRVSQRHPSPTVHATGLHFRHPSTWSERCRRSPPRSSRVSPSPSTRRPAHRRRTPRPWPGTRSAQTWPATIHTGWSCSRPTSTASIASTSCPRRVPRSGTNPRPAWPPTEAGDPGR